MTTEQDVFCEIDAVFIKKIRIIIAKIFPASWIFTMPVPITYFACPDNAYVGGRCLLTLKVADQFESSFL